MKKIPKLLPETGIQATVAIQLKKVVQIHKQLHGEKRQVPTSCASQRGETAQTHSCRLKPD